MKNEVNAVFLFIAELTGSYASGTGDMQAKIECGKQDYINNNLPELDLSLEEDRKELHELVWIKRLYKDLDAYFMISEGSKALRYLSIDTEKYRSSDNEYKWTVPIELDYSASMLQIMGILLNDKRLMEMTNVIGETLQDPWSVEGIPRNMIKKSMTPMLYGSSKQCHELWQDNNMQYTAEHVTVVSKELTTGAFGVANLFKEFIINNANPSSEMKIKIWDNEFDVSCNRFRNVGEKTKAYKVWDSVDKRYNVVLHTDTKQVPDLKQFRRWFVTGLVHGLDSIVMNFISEKVMDKYDWGIPVHDAALISPKAAGDVRKWSSEILERMSKDRTKILSDFFTSIGITSAANSQWNDLKKKVHQFEGELKVSEMALK